MVSLANLMQEWFMKATPAGVAAARTKLAQCRAALLGADPQPAQLAATYLPAAVSEPGQQLEEYLALSDTALVVQDLPLPAHTQILSQHSSHLRALFAADRSSRGAAPAPTETQQDKQHQEQGWAGWWRLGLQWVQAHLSLAPRKCNSAGNKQSGSGDAPSAHSVSNGSLHPQAGANNCSLRCSTGCSHSAASGSCRCSSSRVDLERCGGRLLIRVPAEVQLDEALTVLKCVYAAGPTTSQLHGRLLGKSTKCWWA